MRIEIDQSGKIEETNKDTIIAFSNDASYAVCIKAKTKRRLQEKFRKIGEPRSFVLRVFATGIILLVKNHSGKNLELIIDKEYPGHEAVIKELLIQMFEKNSKGKVQIIRFSLIGKNSNAHIVTFKIKIKKRKIEKVLNYTEIERIAIPKRKQ